jgi:hypothetical protein
MILLRFADVHRPNLGHMIGVHGYSEDTRLIGTTPGRAIGTVAYGTFGQ